MTVAPTGYPHIHRALDQFDEVVQWSIDHDSRIGYFAALYRGITRGILGWLYAPVPHPGAMFGGMNGVFEDAERMDRFVGAFAQRFYDAWGDRTALSDDHPWAVHFDQCDARKRLTIMQYLLSGANAHMNFDLPMAATAVAAESTDGHDDIPLFRSVQRMRGDFDRINDVLRYQIESMMTASLAVSPVLRTGRFLKKRLVQAVQITINWFRAAAWQNAEALIQRPDPEVAMKATEAAAPDLIAGLDPQDLSDQVGQWGRNIGRPPWYLRLLLHGIVARFEPRSPRKVIRALLQEEADRFTW